MAPKILSKGEPEIESEAVRSEYRQYCLVRDYHQRGYDNAMENLRFYYAKNPELGLGQYSIEAVQRLLRAGRQLVQQNFTLPLMDAVAAALVQTKFNADFVPTNGPVTTLTDTLNKSIFSDRELMNWDSHVLDHATKGLLHDSAILMGVDTRYNRLGNIKLTCALMGSTYPDPRWKTAISSECENVWHDAWLTAEDIAKTYEKYEVEIMNAVLRLHKDGTKYGENTGVMPYGRNQTSPSWGSMYRVIERYYLEKKKRKASYLIRPDGDVEIPREVKDEDKGAWLNGKFPGFNPEDVYERTIEDRVSKIVAFCPTLYGKGFLEDGDTEFQCGATPWKFWSASRLEGEPRGLIESVKDSQTYVNYHAGMTTHKIQVEGGGGGKYSNAEIFKNWTEFQRWRKFHNNPAETFEVKQHIIEKGIKPAIPVQEAGGYPAEVYKNIEFFVDKMLPRISKVTPAFLGQSENAGESGYLFRQKKIQADLQTYTIMYGWRLFWNDVYESYMMQAGQTYANEMVERVMPVAGSGGREQIKLNEVVDLGDGNYGIKNDMSQLKNLRHAVIISEKPDSPTDQAERLVLYGEVADKFSKIPGKEASTGAMLSLVVDNMNLRQADKDLLTRLGKLEAEKAVTVLEGEIATAKVNKLNAEATYQAAEAAQKQAEMLRQQGMVAPPSASPGGPIPQITPGGPRPPSKAGGAPPLPQPLNNAQISAGGPV